MTEDSYLGNIADPLTLNRYNYVKSSPLNYTDPSGYAPYTINYGGYYSIGADSKLDNIIRDAVDIFLPGSDLIVQYIEEKQLHFEQIDSEDIVDSILTETDLGSQGYGIRVIFVLFIGVL